jgi:DNA-binding transcriptional MerR regulator
MVKKTKSEKEKTAVSSFYTIGDVAELTGIKTYVLRYWEKEFPFLQPIKNKAGHRLYTKRDVFIIRSIQELLYQKGYSIAGAKKVLWKILLGEQDSSMKQILKELQEDLKELVSILDKNLSTLGP